MHGLTMYRARIILPISKYKILMSRKAKSDYVNIKFEFDLKKNS